MSERDELELHALLQRPQNAIQLVAWDRDVAPIAAMHGTYWHGGMFTLNNTWLDVGWVTLVPPNGSQAFGCCQYTYQPDTESWVHTTPNNWPSSERCPFKVRP